MSRIVRSIAGGGLLLIPGTLGAHPGHGGTAHAPIHAEQMGIVLLVAAIAVVAYGLSRARSD